MKRTTCLLATAEGRSAEEPITSSKGPGGTVREKESFQNKAEGGEKRLGFTRYAVRQKKNKRH